MKFYLVLIAFFGMSCMIMMHAQTFPVTTLLDNGAEDKRIKFVFMGDGYREAELPTYTTHANAVINYMLSQPPIKQYRNFFNFYAIEVPSEESGADHPRTAGDDGNNQQPLANVNTFFNSSFDYAGIHRLLVPQDFGAIYTVLSDNFPTYDQTVILVNSPYYGGAGGDFACASADPSATEVAVHEIGHSFATLADEYAIGGQGERANRTLNTNPATVKWKNWMGDNGIGIYDIGVEGWQRPHQNCKMQFLGAAFCSVCSEAFVNKIYSLVTPIYSYLPVASLVQINGVTTFSAELTEPDPNTLDNQWFLNDNVVASNVLSVDIAPADLEPGENILTLYVTDGTPLSRTYLPGTGYVFSQSWIVSKQASATNQPGKTDKFYYEMSPNPLSDVLNIRGNLDYAMLLGVEVYTETGKQVYRKQIAVEGAYQHSIDMRQLAAGVYTVMLRLPGGFVMQERVVKVK